MNKTHKALISLLILFSYLNGAEKSKVIDLGSHSTTYQIEEDSLFDVMKERYKNTNLERIKDSLNANFEESLKVNLNVPQCQKTIQRDFRPIVKIEEDILEPYTNRVLYKKGTFINILTEFKPTIERYMLFVDSTDEVQKALAYKYQNQADVYVVRGNAKELQELGINAQNIPHKNMLDTLGLQCVPSFYTPQSEGFIISEIYTKEITLEE